MKLLTDNRSAASNVIFPKRGMEVKVIKWCGDWALCERNLNGIAKRFWIVKTKLK